MKIVCIYFDRPQNTKHLAEVFYRFTPQITMRHDRAIFLDISRLQDRYEEETFFKRASHILKQLDIQANFGFAKDLGTALSLAFYGINNKNTLPIECLQFYMDPCGEKEERTKEISQLIVHLKNDGARTLNDFLKISVKELSQHFGSAALMCYIQITVSNYPPVKKFIPQLVPKEKFNFELETRYLWNAQKILAVSLLFLIMLL